jgi:glutaredoxin
MVEGKLINQGQALNRGVLTEAIIDAYAKRSEVSGNVLFGKATCPHCVRAKSYLDEAGIDYAYHDVVRNPRALYEMLTRVKPIVGPKPPITVPRLWLDGRYFSGADQLSTLLEREVEPNPDRGQSSLSAKAA